ncbi:MAG TPA: hypothetical protein VKA34_04565 [Balneolales bacterium]|nr:hypothetical protein [Balneolales bacterium]
MKKTLLFRISIFAFLLIMSGITPLLAQQRGQNDQIDFIIRVESLCSQKDLPDIFLGTIEQFQKEPYLKDIDVSSCNRMTSSNDNAVMTATFSFTSFEQFDNWYKSEHMKKVFAEIKVKSDQLQFRYEQKRSKD